MKRMQIIVIEIVKKGNKWWTHESLKGNNQQIIAE